MPERKQKPQIRFKGFSDAWEQYKLSEIVNFTRGQGLSWSDVDDKNGNYECILYGNLYTDYDTVISKISHKSKIKGTVLSKKFDVLMPASDTTPTGLARALCIVKSGVSLGGDINILSPINNNGMFIAYSLNHNKSELIKRIKGTTVRHLQRVDIEDLKISLPINLEEQSKISEYLHKLDNLITLHQHKYEKLLTLKKSCIEKMFPKNKNKNPEIRFKGFTDTWKQYKLSEMTNDIADGPFGSNLKSEHYTEEKEVRIVQLSNIGEFGWQNENVKYTTFIHAKEISRSIVNAGDLIMAKMMPAGLTIICPNTDKMYVLSSDAVKINLKKNINSNYFICITKSKNFLQQIDNDAQGSTRTRTSISKIRKMDIPAPELSEQLKIGSLFSAIDNLITLHQRKLKMLQNIKKSCLEKMFV